MKTISISGRWVALLTMAAISAAPALAETKITEKMSGDEDSSVLIQRRKNVNIERDYEILTDTDEVSGEPETGWKLAYASWKQACSDWKKEVRENNKENQVLTLNCGRAERIKDATNNGIYTYRSEGKMKIRVRVRAPEKR